MSDFYYFCWPVFFLSVYIYISFYIYFYTLLYTACFITRKRDADKLHTKVFASPGTMQRLLKDRKGANICAKGERGYIYPWSIERSVLIEEGFIQVHCSCVSPTQPLFMFIRIPVNQ